MKENKKRIKITKKQMKAFLRPMFTGTKIFCCATDKDIEKMLKSVLKNYHE